MNEHEHNERQVHFVNTCSEILLVEGNAALASIAATGRSAWVTYLRERQDPASGLFQAAAAPSRQPGGVQASAASFRHTYLALQALDALGASPRHPLRFMQVYDDPQRLEAWLQDLPWQDPRHSAEQVHALLFFFLFQAERNGDSCAIDRLHGTLDWLDQAQSVQTGLWGASVTSPLREQAVAAGLLLPYYEYVRRPLQRFNRMLQTVLELRQADGALVRCQQPDPLGDLALTALMATLHRRTTVAPDHSREALWATHWHLMQTEKAALASDRDAWHNWKRAQLLAVLEDALPDSFPAGPHWQFRRWPAPVYHRPIAHMSAEERATLLRWQRALPAPEAANEQHEAPLISVVIPCYNLGRYLYEALSSVLAQTMSRLEIVVVDDGSGDDFTTLLLDHLQHPQLRLLRQENQGVAAARNAGIEQARAPYICCLDPDDHLRPTYFEKAVTVLQTQPEVGLVTGFFRMFDEREERFQVPSCTLPDMLVYNQAIQASVFRRQAWQEAGGYYGGFSEYGIEDWDLWLTFLEQGWKAHLIPEVVCDYRIRAAQMSERMYEPAVWQRLRRELVLRHRESYERHLPEVIGISGFRWASIRQWANERETALEWWQRQAQHWQHITGEREQHIKELQAWIAELEEAREWLEGQVRR